LIKSYIFLKEQTVNVTTITTEMETRYTKQQMYE